MKRAHCLGSVVADALSKTLARYPVPGKVPQVRTESLDFQLGGCAGNSAAALAQIGIPVAAFSMVGDDAQGRFLLEELERHGVETGGVRVSDEGSTAFTYVGIHPDGDRTFIHTPGVTEKFSLADLDRSEALRADYFLYQNYWNMPLLDGDPGAGLLAEARKNGVVTLIDTSWGYGPDLGLWEVMLPHVDYALPSMEEMQEIYPGLDAEQVADEVHRSGARIVVLKLGKDGVLVHDGTEMVQVPSCATEVVDTTGAGDCFDAGFIAGLAHGLSDLDAARLGSLAAASCIRNVGGAVGIPRLEVLLEGLAGSG